ncbi:hypothetical protein BGX28_005724 [Mortierella sp. GBA30]|nr:hypothetical protein BGX28_005724 [Mortierella sp. GBA30]
MKAIIGVATLTVYATTALCDVSKIVRVDQTSHQFIDALGRSRFFHGINIVKKSHPWHLDVNNFVPGQSMVEKDIETLKDLNINSIRLGIHWAGVEPVRGQYNQTYLDISKDIVRKLQDSGIYTLVVQPQDVWAAQLCGHGAPLWFVKPDWVVGYQRFPVPQKWTPFAVDSNGVPSDADCNSIYWSTSYINFAVGNAFGRLYSNYDNLGDAWANYWKVLAEHFKDLPGVQGYNLMNEPWVGDHMADPTLLIPGFGDRRNMEGLWNKGNIAIRSVDPTTIVYFEGSPIDILSGFNNVPGGDGSKTAHSWHYYSPPQLGSIESTIKNRVNDKERLHCGSFCTEFAVWIEDDTINKAYEAVRVMDRHLESWQGWAYENLWDSSEVHRSLALIYARTYTEATAGKALSFYFQETTAKYEVSWSANTSITAPSLIRISPKYYYPDGIRVLFVPENSSTYTVDGNNVVRLHYTSQTVNEAVIQTNVLPFFPTDIIRNLASGKCLDAHQGTIHENQPVVLQPCSSNWNQVFKFKRGKIMLAWDIDHQHDKYCLDIMGDLPMTLKYQSVVLNPCQEDKLSQQWEVTTTGNVINKGTNKCIDISGSDYKNGQAIVTYACGAGGKQDSQVWTLPRGTNGSW